MYCLFDGNWFHFITGRYHNSLSRSVGRSAAPFSAEPPQMHHSSSGIEPISFVNLQTFWNFFFVFFFFVILPTRDWLCCQNPFVKWKTLNLPVSALWHPIRSSRCLSQFPVSRWTFALWNLLKKRKTKWIASLFVLQNDYFQDDLFPPTKVLWEPSMTASQWFGGANIPPKRMDLKPNDMETRKSFDFAAPPHHQIRAPKITTDNKYPFVCLFPFSNVV